MAVEIDQRLREIQREYLDFLDDEVVILLIKDSRFNLDFHFTCSSS